VPPSDEALVRAFSELAGDAGWRFGQVVAVGPTLPIWNTLAELVRAPLASRGDGDPSRVPLVVALRPLAPDTGWDDLVRGVAREQAGLVLTLEHPDETEAGLVVADVVGVLTHGGVRASAIPVAGRTLADVEHPAARLAGRRLVT